MVGPRETLTNIFVDKLIMLPTFVRKFLIFDKK